MGPEGHGPVDAGPAEHDAVLTNEAARKWQTGNRVLVEIACARGSPQLFALC
jgi:annexin D